MLVVDDSPLTRRILINGLSRDPGIEVVGAAADPYSARDQIVALNPDVMTLDVEMPRMNGVEFLKRLLPQKPMPVIMVSSWTEKGSAITLEALSAGAIDFVTKPKFDESDGYESMIEELRLKVIMASKAQVGGKKISTKEKSLPVFKREQDLTKSKFQLIAVGASTGGTEAIRRVVSRLPASTPGIVIVQHMPPGFTKTFAQRLDKECIMDIKEAEDGDVVTRSTILIAPGDYHLMVERSGKGYIVTCHRGDKVNGHRPSVEVLFNSVAENVGANAIGVLLTGMGNDGSEAMLTMRRAGCRTLAQDEATSVVFGMPGEAYRRGGAERLVPIHTMANSIVDLLLGELNGDNLRRCG